MFRAKAERLAKDSTQAGQILDAAFNKAGVRQEALKDVREQFQTLMRLLRAAIKGRYRQVPWSSLVTGLAAVVYFVNPLDVIPDFLIGVGLLDDLTVIAFALNALKGDLTHFRQWEDEHGA